MSMRAVLLWILCSSIHVIDAALLEEGPCFYRDDYTTLWFCQASHCIIAYSQWTSYITCRLASFPD